MKMSDYFVQQRKDKLWEAKKVKSKRASKTFKTQKEAEKRAKELSAKSGGGEVRIKGKDGLIRDSDTVSPGKDPSDIKDTKH